MAYRQVYFRIHTKGYSSGWSSDADRSAFKEESCRLFQELGWTIKLGHNGGYDVATKNQQNLYLHPTGFSSVIDESNIQSLQRQILKAQTFRYEGVNCYEEYQDLSDEGYQAALETQRGC